MDPTRPHPNAVDSDAGRCFLPADLSGWGWAVQLYAARSSRSWGIGDLGDLATLARWSAELGARFLLVSPLHAPLPTRHVQQQPSPYFPSSRLFLDPLHLRIEDGPDVTDLAASGRALDADRRIDRDAVGRLKGEALARRWAAFAGEGDPAFDKWCAEQGEVLTTYATFCALAEDHEGGWRAWPAEHRHPSSPAVARFREERGDRVRFHAWVQWLLADQLRQATEAAAAGGVALVHDLAVGVAPDGYDAWLWQDVLADGCTVGAPPDEFTTQGQDWGVVPFDPERLRAVGYEPFRQTLRAVLRPASGLRVDHVMGLFRLFWVAAGEGPGAGTYVRYPADDLLAVLAEESRRVEAFVVGEDLGTVEDGVRAELAARAVLSYRLLWFEDEPPPAYPRQALAAVTTHDLPTVAGLWTGADLAAQRRLGLAPAEESMARMRARVRDGLGLADDAPVGEVVQRVYEWLATAPSMLVSATLEDALEVVERPNMPGTTTDQWPNWSLALPMPLEDLVRDYRPRAIATAFRRRSEREGASTQ